MPSDEQPKRQLPTGLERLCLSSIRSLDFGIIDAAFQAEVARCAKDDPYDRRPFPGWPLPNVWLGTSVEDQKRADERIPHLLRCPAAVRFLSVEPLLGAVDLRRIPMPIQDSLDALTGERVDGGTGRICEGGPWIDWVIVESGPGARPCYENWVRSIVEQCKAAGVAVFTKQLGANVRCIDEEFGDQPIKLKDAKGGAMEEWPTDLQIRQMPAGVGFTAP